MLMSCVVCCLHVGVWALGDESQHNAMGWVEKLRWAQLFQDHRGLLKSNRKHKSLTFIWSICEAVLFVEANKWLKWLQETFECLWNKCHFSDDYTFTVTLNKKTDVFIWLMPIIRWESLQTEMKSVVQACIDFARWKEVDQEIPIFFI